MEVFLYKLEGCDACDKARELLESQGHTIREIMIDNPLLMIGVQLLFKDSRVHAPVVVIPDVGMYILNTEGTQLFRIANLKPEINESEVIEVPV